MPGLFLLGRAVLPDSSIAFGSAIRTCDQHTERKSMKTLRHLAAAVFLIAVCASFSLADEPGKHPHYLHALSDLRDARAHLEKFTDSDRLNDEELRAIDEIDRAIGEIKKASIDDGKNINDHMPIDTHLGHKGRYHKALELLDKAHNDVARE